MSGCTGRVTKDECFIKHVKLVLHLTLMSTYSRTYRSPPSSTLICFRGRVLFFKVLPVGLRSFWLVMFLFRISIYKNGTENWSYASQQVSTLLSEINSTGCLPYLIHLCYSNSFIRQFFNLECLYFSHGNPIVALCFGGFTQL